MGQGELLSRFPKNGQYQQSGLHPQQVQPVQVGALGFSSQDFRGFWCLKCRVQSFETWGQYQQAGQAYPQKVQPVQVGGHSEGDRLRVTTRAEDAQGTSTQSHVSPSILVYND